MATAVQEQVTQQLQGIRDGDEGSIRALMASVYDDLRVLAARHLSRESPDHILQPTALVHEVFMKLVDQSKVDWQGRTHFLAVSSEAMRRILVDHARHRLRLKRGGGQLRIPLDESLQLSPHSDADVLAVDEAISRLGELDPRQAKIIEMRFFGGMTVAEVASALGVSKRTVEAEWTMIRAWMRRELSEDADA